MGNIEVEIPKNLNQYLKSLERRGKAFMRSVVHQAASSFKEKVEERAKQFKQDYANAIKLKKLAGALPAFVIIVDEKAVEMGSLAAASVIFYEPISKTSAVSPVTTILRKYGPFPRELLPLKVDRRYYRLTSRSVSPQEFETIKTRVSSKFEEIRQALLKSGITRNQLLDMGKVDTKIPVIEDLVFRTLRREFGVRTQRVPVWLPTIKEFKEGKLTKKLLKDKKTARILQDPTYKGWANAGLVKESVPSSTKDDLDEFQKKILKKA